MNANYAQYNTRLLIRMHSFYAIYLGIVNKFILNPKPIASSIGFENSSDKRET